MYDVYEIRKQFPMLDGSKKMQGKPLVFLDSTSTTFKPQSVIDAIVNYYSNETSNSHRGDYDLCYKVDVEVGNVRRKVAQFINCAENEVVFTSGDTMSLNLIAYGYALKFLKAGDEIIISEEEHASNTLPWFKVAEKLGVVIKYIPLTKDGELTADNLKKVISKRTKIVSVAHISNVLGYEVDIKRFAEIAHEYGAIMIADGAQSVPHLKSDFKEWDVDFLTFSGHKMCGPTGIGCLIGKYELLDKMDTFLTGGGMNVTFGSNGTMEILLPPAKFEAGTLNIAGILGLGKALEFIQNIGLDDIRQHDIDLIEYAKSKLEKFDNIIIYNKKAKGSILTFNINGVFSQDEGTLLNYKGIACRSGLHCAKMMPNVLNTQATVRMSVYLYTTKEEIDAFVDAIINGGDILDAYFND